MKDVHFRRINATNVLEICNLSNTLSKVQRDMVADNAISIAQASFSENAWFRSIYAGDHAIGFIMLHQSSNYDDGIDVHGIYLWRFMIAGPYQGKGYGKQAIELLIKHLKGHGINEMVTSCEVGEGSPIDFYKQLGFTPNGETFEGETGLVLQF
ncbi:GNAT family N-acetyltransferase [Bacillus sp. JJ722]|uniref:GNAT family N-acetyltransferase n=1 Tax=Bacillus sp. JJ722 TaxID=3122973 RepID=UPI00300066B5